jgi:hypothetical protein
VDPVAGAARAASVLRQGGLLAVFWNAFEPPAELREAFAGVFRLLLPDSPAAGFWTRPALDAYRFTGAKAADGMRQSGAFGEPEEWLSRWERPYTREEWLDLMPTTGGFTRLPEAVQARALDGLGAAVDAAGGSFVMGYSTLTVTAARLAGWPAEPASRRAPGARPAPPRPAGLGADTGPADADPFGGAGEVRFPGDGDQVLQLAQFHNSCF